MKPFEIKQLLMATDFSTMSTNALQTALAICKRQHAKLTLMHVIENTYMLSPLESSGTAHAVLASLIKFANEKLTDLAKQIHTEHGVLIDFIVQAGNPADEICAWALHNEIDMIAVGTHGASGFRECFLGSTAYRVVKNSPCIVLTIPGSQTWLEFKKIFFPIRMVPNALEKYNIIRPIIKKNNSTLVIAGLAKLNDPELLADIQTITDAIQNCMSSDRAKCTSKVYSCENAAQQVLEISEAEQPDLIVITATMNTCVKDFFLDPYVQDIVNLARFPVLSVRPRLTQKFVRENYNELFPVEEILSQTRAPT